MIAKIKLKLTCLSCHNTEIVVTYIGVGYDINYYLFYNVVEGAYFGRTTQIVVTSSPPKNNPVLIVL